MSDEKAATGNTFARSIAVSAFVTLALLILLCGGCWMLFLRHERLATFALGSYTVNVYAESELLYEPPGYISFELKQWGQTRIPERRFMGIGSERKPRERFTIITADNGDVMALVLDKEIQMIHEFSSGFTWPGPYTNVTEAQWEIAELLLQKLLAFNPGVRCSRQDSYRKELDRRKAK